MTLYSHCKIIDSHRRQQNITTALSNAIQGIALQMEMNNICLSNLDKISINYESNIDYGDLNNSWLIIYEDIEGDKKWLINPYTMTDQQC